MREVRIRDTLSGEPRPLDPASPRGRDLRLRADRLQPHPHRQRPALRRLLALRRFLPRLGYEPRLVVNVTDINDKIYAAAREAGEPSAEFAARMTRAYFEDTDRLGLGRPDAEPLATETIAGIVALIAELVEGGHAYESGGDVYFRVRSFDGLRQALQPPPGGHGPGRGGRLGLAEGGPARLRPLEGAQAGRGHAAGTRPGAPGGPAGTSSAR